MNTAHSELDKRLQALFGRLDTGAGFDARLMARLRTESQADAVERVSRARQRERARYHKALLELQSWRRSMLRLLTLDTLGIAFLLVIAAVTAWPHLSRDVLDISSHYGPTIAMLLGVLPAAMLLVGIWADRTRSPLRLL